MRHRAGTFLLRLRPEGTNQRRTTTAKQLNVFLARGWIPKQPSAIKYKAYILKKNIIVEQNFVLPPDQDGNTSFGNS